MVTRTVTGAVPLNGVEIGWSSMGAGTPFVLSHGFTGASTDWDGVVDALSRHRRVITFDHRGHGLSTNTGDASTYSFDQLVDDMAAFIDALELAEFDLLGHSMGGIVAMRLALRRPAGLRSLVLMDTGAQPSPGLAHYLRPGIDIVRDKGMVGLLELQAPAEGDSAAAQEEAAARRWKLEHMDPVAFVTLGEELSDHRSILDEIGSLQLPVTVIVGENDIAFREPSRRLTAGIPNAALEIIPAAAHSPQVENREAWLAAVHRHFDRIG